MGGELRYVLSVACAAAAADTDDDDDGGGDGGGGTATATTTTMYSVTWKNDALSLLRQEEEGEEEKEETVVVDFSDAMIDGLTPVYQNLFMAVKVTSATATAAQPPPFHFKLGCVEWPRRRPAVLELWVDPAEFRRQWHTKHFVAGETYVARLLHDSVKHEALFLKQQDRDGDGDADRVGVTRKRKRRDSSVGDNGDGDGDGGDVPCPTPTLTPAPTQRAMSTWMWRRERAMVSDSLAVPYLKQLVVPETGVVFCLEECVFVDAAASPPDLVRLRGGLIIGERNAGKSLVIKDLVYGGREHLEVTAAAAAAATTRRRASAPPPPPPPRTLMLKPLHATLLVVPSSLVLQWHQYFKDDATVLCVNTHQARRKIKAARVEAATVVIVSHRVFLSHLGGFTQHHGDAMHDRIRARVFASGSGAAAESVTRAELYGGDDNDEEVVHLNWYMWDRIVVDEVLQFGMEQRRMRVRECAGSTFQSLVWWGLQGDVAPDNPRLLPLIRVMCASSRSTGSGVTALSACCHAVVDVPAFLKASVYVAPPLPQTSVGMWLERTIYSELTAHEQSVYDTLVHLDAPVEALRQVCAGDTSFMNKYMVTVERWADAIPLGVEAINQCMLFSEPFEDDVQFVTRIALHLSADGGRGSDASSSPTVADADDDADDDAAAAAAVSEAEADSDDGNGNDDGDMEAETRFLVELTRDIRERRDYFLKTVVQLSKRETTPPACGVCLANTCDCVFVCGHMLCHVCIIDLFDSNAKNNTDYPEMMAPCPTCRWNIEPNEVFWVLNQPLSNPSKFDGLLRVARRGGGSTVVFSESSAVLRFWYQKCSSAAATGVTCRLLCSPMQLCSSSYISCVSGGGGGGKHPQLLFVYIGKGAGLKLHNVRNVVFMPPASASFQREALKCIITTPEEEMLSIVRLVATDTVEFHGRCC